MQWNAAIINVYGSLFPVGRMCELQSQVVTGDRFIIPGVNGYESHLL